MGNYQHECLTPTSATCRGECREYLTTPQNLPRTEEIANKIMDSYHGVVGEREYQRDAIKQALDTERLRADALEKELNELKGIK